MKKVLLSLLFITFCISAKAQNVIDRQTIKNNPNEQLVVYANEDISILTNTFSNFNPDFGPELTQIFYNKYKMLTSELTEEELFELTESIKDQLNTLFGEDLYLEVSENEAIFNRITGIAYLAH